mmetsp:Transcript_33427/g.69925  ORF Transcript_33427/g.69925 Transcript_33427/m.69925 type:complete len:512 (-) Transcript_33427:143-1678(-)|eukprot:CAMPEP_0201118266 /NCGR_PEP_ID=MMETSP0850-20130426/2399_1 /ASSEMBLY_ACC=CAM_ASM_000622 /TAXON_ID=183588 /ORGANISM="Pseudo-nitzschia fraudulenta, Strain WWA7" /LENGTH=511 /DNA_ID=CAMNT_0047383325 /DNA_START=17 /DNA_END=1552 /DNA_ORIENTATION=+
MSWFRMLAVIACLATKALAEDTDADPFGVAESINQASGQSRMLASLHATATSSPEFLMKRKSYPENDPHICLAFLSCCQRIDLLNHTIAGVIRHMEEDEPSYLRYEMAWVDNGNSKSETDYIKESYPIERALTLSKNMGLAYGMNLLINNLCTAPYILLLEEDWLYLDEIVAEQTEERKRVIATSVALLENTRKNNVKAFDGRNIMGTFLRHESYESFMELPHAGDWKRREDVDMLQILSPPTSSGETCSDDTMTCSDDTTTIDPRSESDEKVNIDYRLFCATDEFTNVWGSYTNGAGLYRRSDLMKHGRQFGEPGDAFHDRYVESNFAYRVGRYNCHAALRLTKDESCTSINDPLCTGAFHHIGERRGTRPQLDNVSACLNPLWNFFGTEEYDEAKRFLSEVGKGVEDLGECTEEQLNELRDRDFRERDAENYKEKVRKQNEDYFRKDTEMRQKMRDESTMVLDLLARGHGNEIRNSIPFASELSDDELAEKMSQIEKLANSPHPINPRS